MNPVDRFINSLDRVKSTGNGKWKACCPAHDDKNPSLEIAEGDSGTVLIKCWAGCETSAVVGALGLQMSDLFLDDKRKSSSGRKSIVPAKLDRRPEVQAANDDATAQRSFNLVRADQIEFKPTDWLIDGWLVKDTLAGLVAPSGACKSFLAIDWACRVATGSLWFGRNVKQGAVFYLAGEGRTGLRKRIAAWEKHNGISISGAPLYLADSLPFLCDEVSTATVISAIQEVADAIFLTSGCDPELIVIDTVARAMSGANENSSEDMGKFIGALDWLRSRWGATVLTVHHTGHDPSNQERGRGSSAYKAALDSEMVIKPGDPEFTLKATKAKDWAEPSPLTLRRVPVAIELPQGDGTVLHETSLALHDATGALVESKRIELVIDLFRQGKTQREIAEETGTPKTTVQRWLKKAA
jgi:hypothetical protein